jgi:hypothetical protein
MKETTSVTFCMKIRPLSWNFGFAFLSTGAALLEPSLLFGLAGSIGLQQQRIFSKR